MAFLQKKPQVSSSAPLYTIGSSRTVLIIGLGNPEKQHAGTRHNIGFAIVDYFAKQNNFPGWILKKDLKSEISQTNLGDSRVILVKPSTYMNNSGQAVVAVQHYYRVYNQNTLAIYDELAIPFGQLRTRVGGSDAGHNGVKSLIQHLGDDFGRLRLGIASEVSQKADSSNFVLGKFTKAEQAKLPLVWREAHVLITEYIFSGQLPHQTRTVL